MVGDRYFHVRGNYISDQHQTTQVYADKYFSGDFDMSVFDKSPLERLLEYAGKLNDNHGLSVMFQILRKSNNTLSNMKLISATVQADNDTTNGDIVVTSLS